MAKYELLVAIISTVCIVYIHAACKEDNYFECPLGAAPNITIYDDTTLSCPPKTLCNHECALSGNETIVRPCLTPALVCKYTCYPDAPATVNVNLVNFTCSDGYQCNQEYDSCNVCVPKPCDKTQYTCKNSTTVLFPSGLELTCPRPTVCNKDYLYPCSPCIDLTSKSTPTGLSFFRNH